MQSETATPWKINSRTNVDKHKISCKVQCWCAQKSYKIDQSCINVLACEAYRNLLRFLISSGHFILYQNALKFGSALQNLHLILQHFHISEVDAFTFEETQHTQIQEHLFIFNI
ncbi:Hypothetical_protein [Hexamita inflata]|uniref:Hypothetical_protein n=1 Tax=Hexamita inflata TaxID=28002 RepID=A0AA86U5N6_9EUKA|nr:Hypothetical protein HINF_LOCUS29534 [Hexamita inflata]